MGRRMAGNPMIDGETRRRAAPGRTWAAQQAAWGAARGIILCMGLLLCMPALSGCGRFFQPSSTGTGSGSGSGSGSGTGSGSSLNSVYVANSNPQLDTIAAFSLASGTLTTLANSPSQLTSIPSALAINPAGTLLWAASELGEVYVYVINADGSLTLGASGNPVAGVAGSAMVVDPTGQWLLVESNTGTDAPVLVNVYQIDSTNGTLTAASTPQVTLDAGSAAQLTFAPNGTQLFAALGTGGVDVLTFSPVSGVLAKLNVLLKPLGNSYADQGLAVEPTGAYLLVAETGTNGVRVLSISADGTLTQVGSPYSTGNGARAVLVDSTGAYVYVSNAATNTISGFSLSTAGALTALAGSPYATGTSPYSLSEDNTHSYLIAACLGGSPDLQVFSITPATGTTPGALVAASTASTGTAGTVSGAISVATTP